MLYEETKSKNAAGYGLSIELANSKHIFELFNESDGAVDFQDIQDRFVFALPKIDYFLSITSITTNTNIRSLIRTYFTGRLKRYLITCLDQGYIGRFGATVDPSSYLLDFPASEVSLLWIPKNSCTTLKREFISKEPVDASAFVRKTTIHKSAKRNFGVNRNKFIHGNYSPSVCVIRNPIARIISCYLDKFANPTIKAKNFERFAIRHLEAAQIRCGVEPNPGRSITFNEFLDYVIGSPRWDLNSHWRPQCDFLPTDTSNVKFGTVENLSEFFNDLDIEYIPKNYNISYGGSISSATAGDLSDKLPKDLVNEDIKNYGRFLTDANNDRLHRFLSQDLSLYNSITRV